MIFTGDLQVPLQVPRYRCRVFTYYITGAASLLITRQANRFYKYEFRSCKTREILNFAHLISILKHEFRDYETCT